MTAGTGGDSGDTAGPGARTAPEWGEKRGKRAKPHRGLLLSPGGSPSPAPERRSGQKKRDFGDLGGAAAPRNGAGDGSGSLRCAFNSFSGLCSPAPGHKTAAEAQPRPRGTCQGSGHPNRGEQRRIVPLNPNSRRVPRSPGVPKPQGRSCCCQGGGHRVPGGPLGGAGRDSLSPPFWG